MALFAVFAVAASAPLPDLGVDAADVKNKMPARPTPMNKAIIDKIKAGGTSPHAMATKMTEEDALKIVTVEEYQELMSHHKQRLEFKDTWHAHKNSEDAAL